MQRELDTRRAWHQYPIVWLGLGTVCFVLALTQINLALGPLLLGEVRPTRATFEAVMSHNVPKQVRYITTEGYLNTDYYVYESSGDNWPRWYLLFAPGDTASYIASPLSNDKSDAIGDRPALIIGFRNKTIFESFSASSTWTGTLQEVDSDVAFQFRPGIRTGLHLSQRGRLLPLELSDQMLMVGEKPSNTWGFVLLGLSGLFLLFALGSSTLGIKRFPRAVLVPYDKPIRFLRQCVYCLAPATTVQDIEITGGTTVNKQQYRFKVPLKIPYCREHAQQSIAMEESIKKIWTRSIAIALVVSAGIIFVVSRSGAITSTDLIFVGGLSIGTTLLAAHIVLRVIAQWRNPLMQDFSDVLGFGGQLIIEVDKQMDTVIGVSKIKFEFKNPEYAHLFVQANRLAIELLEIERFIRQQLQHLNGQRPELTVEELSERFKQGFTKEEKEPLGANLDADVQTAIKDALHKMEAAGQVEYHPGPKLWRLRI